MTRLRDEAGSIVMEVPYLGPVLILLIVVVARVGISGSAQLQVEDAARQAARAATFAYSVEEARSLAAATARTSLDRQGVSCARVEVDIDTAMFRPGGHAKAMVSCHLSLPLIRGLPSGRTTSAQAIDVVDQHRSLR